MITILHNKIASIIYSFLTNNYDYRKKKLKKLALPISAAANLLQKSLINIPARKYS